MGGEHSQNVRLDSAIAIRGLFLVSDWDSKWVLQLGSAHCSKNHYNMPINTTPSEKKNRSFERNHELVNMNHSTLYETRNDSCLTLWVWEKSPCLNQCWVVFRFFKTHQISALEEFTKFS